MTVCLTDSRLSEPRTTAKIFTGLGRSRRFVAGEARWLAMCLPASLEGIRPGSGFDQIDHGLVGAEELGWDDGAIEDAAIHALAMRPVAHLGPSAWASAPVLDNRGRAVDVAPGDVAERVSWASGQPFDGHRLATGHIPMTSQSKRVFLR